MVKCKSFISRFLVTGTTSSAVEVLKRGTFFNGFNFFAVLFAKSSETELELMTKGKSL